MSRWLRPICVWVVLAAGAGLQASERTDPGLLCEFYDRVSGVTDFPDVTGVMPTATSVASSVNFAQSGVNFPSSATNQQFFARWSGLVRISAAGTYTFYLNSDDGSRLYVDGVLVVNNGGTHGMIEKSTAALALAAGDHDLRLEFFQGGGPWGCIFSWSSSSVAKAVVPASVLFHRVTVTEQPVKISSSLTANASVGGLFQYTAAATGPGPITFSITNLPAGLTVSGAVISGVPAAAGTALIDILAYNGSGSFDRQTLVLTIYNTTFDTDQDGFPDEVELAAGTDPYSSASVPVAGVSEGQPFTISKLQIKLDGVSTRDQINISGLLPVGHLNTQLNLGGCFVVFDIGGVVIAANLDLKSTAETALGKIAMGMRGGRNSVQNASFKCQFAGDFKTILARQGLALTQAEGKARKTLYAYVVANGAFYGQNADVVYSVKNGKGAAKLFKTGK